jgi:hypothetical protein
LMLIQRNRYDDALMWQKVKRFQVDGGTEVVEDGETRQVGGPHLP